MSELWSSESDAQCLEVLIKIHYTQVDHCFHLPKFYQLFSIGGNYSPIEINFEQKKIIQFYLIEFLQKKE